MIGPELLLGVPCINLLTYLLIVIQIFVWWSPKGRCYGNQLNLGDVCRCRQERPLLVALAFNSGLVHHDTAFKRLNGSNLPTSCTNSVNFHPIIFEFTLLKRAIFAAIRSQFDDQPSFVMFAFRNRLEDNNSNFRRVIINHFCTSCRNLARLDQ